MSPTKDEIKAWLKDSGRDRQWLAEQCAASKNTVNNWLSTDINVPSKALRIIDALMKADAEAERAKSPAPPMTVVLEVEPEKFDAYNQAAMRKNMLVRDWAINVLNDAAAEGVVAPPLIALPAVAEVKYSRGKSKAK